MNDDVSINYAGGSGGFLALWILLLGTNYRCIFDHTNQDLKDIFTNHWKSINEHGQNNMLAKQWKATEIWPSNDRTLREIAKKRVFFVCNDKWTRTDCFNIVVYTDSKTHLKICKTKRCFIFVDKPTLIDQHKLLDQLLIEKYNNVKADSWPKLESYKDTNNLDDIIKHELEQEYGFYCDVEDIEQMFLKCFSEKHEDDFVLPQTRHLLSTADLAIKWQDLIHTNGNCLLQHFGKSHTPEIAEFIDYYKNELDQKKFLEDKTD